MHRLGDEGKGVEWHSTTANVYCHCSAPSGTRGGAHQWKGFGVGFPICFLKMCSLILGCRMERTIYRLDRLEERQRERESKWRLMKKEKKQGKINVR